MPSTTSVATFGTIAAGREPSGPRAAAHIPGGSRRSAKIKTGGRAAENWLNQLIHVLASVATLNVATLKTATETTAFAFASHRDRFSAGRAVAVVGYIDRRRANRSQAAVRLVAEMSVAETFAVDKRPFGLCRN